MITPNWKLTAVALVLGLIVGGAFCWWATSTSYDADIATLNSQHDKALKSISDHATANSEAQ